MIHKTFSNYRRPGGSPTQTKQMCVIISCYKLQQCQIKADGSEIIKGTCPATVRTMKGHVRFLPTVR